MHIFAKIYHKKNIFNNYEIFFEKYLTELVLFVLCCTCLYENLKKLFLLLFRKSPSVLTYNNYYYRVECRNVYIFYLHVIITHPMSTDVWWLCMYRDGFSDISQSPYTEFHDHPKNHIIHKSRKKKLIAIRIARQFVIVTSSVVSFVVRRPQDLCKTAFDVLKYIHI